MSKLKTKPRRTPWDTRSIDLSSGGSQQTPVESRPCEHPTGGLYLRGLYVFDPMACTSEDMRHFFWAGLQLLDSEVRHLGLEPDEVRQLMLKSFDTFHDAANGLWDAVRQMMAMGGEDLPIASAVEARCRILAPVGCGGTRRAAYPASIPPSRITVAETAAKACESSPAASGTGSREMVESLPPLNDPAMLDKNAEAEDFPVADFYEPAAYGWTPTGYEVRAALKRYSESSHADC